MLIVVKFSFVLFFATAETEIDLLKHYALFRSNFKPHCIVPVFSYFSPSLGLVFLSLLLGLLMNPIAPILLLAATQAPFLNALVEGRHAEKEHPDAIDPGQFMFAAYRLRQALSAIA